MSLHLTEQWLTPIGTNLLSLTTLPFWSWILPLSLEVKTVLCYVVCIETLFKIPELAQPICLPSSNDYEDQTALLIGNLRKYSTMSFVNENDCEAYWGPSENIICTEANCDCDIATGILVIPGPNYQQIGIAGMGSTMGCIPGLPKTYTEVYPYLDWISSVTGVQLK